jgi:integrase
LRLAAHGEVHRNGTPIRFHPPPEKQNKGSTTLFPLHSLRVSLITALALEGQVPFPLLQKLVGHSRLLMTLNYVNPRASHVRDVLLNAAKLLEERGQVFRTSFSTLNTKNS